MKQKISFENEEKHENVALALPRPGPTLLIVVKTEEKVVSKSNPFIEITSTERMIPIIYTAK